MQPVTATELEQVSGGKGSHGTTTVTVTTIDAIVATQNATNVVAFGRDISQHNSFTVVQTS